MSFETVELICNTVITLTIFIASVWVLIKQM